MKNHLKKQTWRIVIIITLIVAAIYGVLFFWGQIPNIKQVELITKPNSYDSLTLVLPYSISRLWDIIFLFFYLFLLFKLLNIKDCKNKNNRHNNPAILRLAYSSAIGVTTGIITGFIGYLIGLEIIIIIGLSFGLITGLMFGSNTDFVFFIEDGLIAGIILAIIINFFFGSIFSIIFGFIFSGLLILSTLIGSLIRINFNRIQ